MSLSFKGLSSLSENVVMQLLLRVMQLLLRVWCPSAAWIGWRLFNAVCS